MPKRQFKKLLIVIFLALLIENLPANAVENVNYKIYVTNKVSNNQPTNTAVTEFDCADRIYLVVEASGLIQGEHQLTVKWINPANELQELTNYDFQAYAYSRIWAWLQLHGPTGAVIGQIFDPSLGMEDFIGEWSAKVLIDRDQVDDLKFNVLC